jgi:hypothetical protein
MERRTWFRLYYICLVVVAIANILHLYLHHPHHEFWWLGIPLFTAVFAIIGGLLLLAFSKLAVYPLIKREEDYYEKH